MVHIIIPMSGAGERFQKAGYALPKPLIEVDGEPIIKHVVSLFSPQDRFTFICNERHLNETEMRTILEKLVPSANIIAIPAHKEGPVSAVLQAAQCIVDDEETIVNYCDFGTYWNYQDFLAHTRTRRADGAIPAYKGFHPHMLGSDNYAFIKEREQWLEAIQEKKPWTDNKMNEYASNGTYYFRRGEFVRTYFKMLMNRRIEVNGEFYVSMVFNLMIEDGLRVSVYEIQNMLQWGTPGDLFEYQRWSDYFRKVLTNSPSREPVVDVCLMPMAGRGSRFVSAGYETPKPLIPVSGKPMIVQACESLPQSERQVFVVLDEHLKTSALENTLREHFSNVTIKSLEGVTEGQAVTCAAGILEARPSIGSDQSILIGACDNGMLYDKNKFAKVINDPSIDIAAFSFRNHAGSARHPEMYGWLKVDHPDSELPRVTGVSVKKPISDKPRLDHAIVGAFYFRRAGVFLDLLEILKEKNLRVNGEFYVDSLIGVAVDSGLSVVAFEVDEYVCFGTPDDLQTFEYWQSFFHKCDWHPYCVEKDQFALQRDNQLLGQVNKTLKQTYV